VLLRHGTPRSETEVFTKRTAEEKLLPLMEPLEVAAVICGHTHMQFDRKVGRTRVVNPGSVGYPFGRPGACWALLGPDIELRHTQYDLAAAAASFRTTGSPRAEQDAREVQSPPSEAEILDLFGTVELS